VANPCDWGWKMIHNTLTPVMTDESPGPNELLNVIRCKCKTTSRNPCGTNLCSCKQNNLQCVSACDNCHGNLCNNCDETSDAEGSSSDEESHRTVYMFDEDECLDEEVIMDVDTIAPPTLDDEMDDEDLLWFAEETVG
jgi:hypothetical protein